MSSPSVEVVPEISPYEDTVWSNTSATDIYKLQLVQNFAARIILGLRKYGHISAGLRSLRWLNVKERLVVNDAVKCTNLSKDCHLVICQTNFQRELLFMIDRRDIEIV